MFPSPAASWVSDHNIIHEPRFAKFPSQNVADDVEPKASKIASSITLDHLSEFSTLYNIPPDYDWFSLIIMSGLLSHSPFKSFSMYEKNLKLGIPLSLLPFITNIFHFWNLTLVRSILCFLEPWSAS